MTRQGIVHYKNIIAHIFWQSFLTCICGIVLFWTQDVTEVTEEIVLNPNLCIHEQSICVSASAHLPLHILPVAWWIWKVTKVAGCSPPTSAIRKLCREHFRCCMVIWLILELLATVTVLLILIFKESFKNIVQIQIFSRHFHCYTRYQNLPYVEKLKAK